MKKTTMALLAILSVIVSFAQAPQTFKYQAVARDNGGNVLINQNVSFQIAIIWDLTMYIPSYYETHTSTTSELGLVILEVGNGTATFGVFDTINWSRGNYFIEIGLDPDGGNSYTLTGTSPLLAVPYALYAESSADSSRWNKVLNDIYYNEGAVGIGTDAPIAPLTINGVVGPDILFGPDFESDIMSHNVMNLGASDPFNVNLLTNNLTRLTVDEDGKIGIGTQTPSEQLELTENIKLAESTDSLHGVFRKGDNPFIHDYSAPGSWGDNLFIGKYSGNFTMAIDGAPNHSSRNTAIGDFSLNSNTSGYENSAFGFNAMRYNKTGYGNSAVGVAALYSNTKGYGNTAIGFKSLLYSDSSNYNTAVGYQSMISNDEGNQNTAIGYSALSSNKLGSDNVALGYTAMIWPTAGSRNVCIGSQAGFSAFNTNFSGNVAIGYMAGRNLNNNADYNVLIGAQTGTNITSGFRNILIGSFVNAPLAEGSYQLNIGNTIYGDLLTGKIGIGLNNPTYELEVNGTVYATNFMGDGSALTGIGDNLGDHSANQNIALNNHWISGDGNNEGIFVDNSGLVGIGKSNPYSSLDVYGQWGFALQAKNDLNAVAVLAYGNDGVIGETPSGSGNSAGVTGRCISTDDVGALGRNGIGVYGLSDTWAGYFEGKGYFEDYVGFGTTTPAAMIDVYGPWGWALQAKNDLNAVALLAYNKTGVLGETHDGSGNSAGVEGRCFITNDIGALGKNGIGVFGTSDTWAGYFEGKGYFEDYVGFGTTTPAAMIDVYGPWGWALQAKNDLNAVALLAYNKTGVLGETHDGSGNSAGVEGRCFITDDIGALGKNGIGVYGLSDSWAGYFEGNVFMDGYIGIGTTEPDVILDIVSPVDGFISLERNTDFHGGITYKESGTSQWIFPYFRGWQSDNLIVRDEGNLIDVMTFEYGTGCVGVGTNTPGGYKLYVNGTAYSSGGWTGSDEKLKKNISEIQNPLEILAQLEGVYYNFRQEEYPEKSLPDGKHFGVIAQDVEKILPDMVKTGPDGMKAVAYDELIPILIEALKEQQERIDYLDKKLEDLTTK